jgi:hypothetical protein
MCNVFWLVGSRVLSVVWFKKTGCLGRPVSSEKRKFRKKILLHKEYFVRVPCMKASLDLCERDYVFPDVSSCKKVLVVGLGGGCGMVFCFD